MSIGAISGLASSYLTSIFSGSQKPSASSTSETSLSSSQPDNSQLSPFAQLLTTLQQVQQSNPTQYQQVTQQIASNLQSAAQTAQSQGNTTAATTLNQLSTDFTNASKSGQMPNIQDLARATSHHGGHHHMHAASSDSDSSSSTSTTNQPLSQLLSSLQFNSSTSDSLNPMSIITSTLQSSGVSLTS